MLKTAILGVLSALTLLALGVAIAATSVGDHPIAKAPRDSALAWGACPGTFMPEGCRMAVLRGNPRARADVYVKLPAGSRVPSHTHSSPERMVLVSGELQVLYDGHQPVTLEPGMYAYGPPRQPHEATCAGGAPCVIFISFDAPLDALRYTKGAQ